MKKIYSIINQKGGVGKTTTTINLGTAMAACGANVLLVDMDPQGNLSTGMGVEKYDRKKGVYDILVNNTPLDDVLIKTDIKNLDLIPSNDDLLGIDILLSNEADRVMRLKKAIEELKNYDYISRKKDNNFSKEISVNNYIHIHLDEKWFTNLYIKSYTDINPTYDDFIKFINSISDSENVLITTGIMDSAIIEKLKQNSELLIESNDSLQQKYVDMKVLL